ncbi:hypothetical protein BRADI_3g16051v3 [Brachypodium distachyon]|uniref:DUF834 domain-containing protein n=1 Tax=Brachypodium distachyon TaxID=15368 RepID=A0A2K2CXF4_BRADI|nr:hypothetical protein BRADI_3g16051v3 [Brachypodium distachyon]
MLREVATDAATGGQPDLAGDASSGGHVCYHRMPTMLQLAATDVASGGRRHGWPDLAGSGGVERGGQADDAATSGHRCCDWRPAMLHWLPRMRRAAEGGAAGEISLDPGKRNAVGHAMLRPDAGDASTGDLGLER